MRESGGLAILLPLLFILVQTTAGIAQVQEPDETRNPVVEEYEIPSLDTLIAAAIDHSPVLATHHLAVASSRVDKQLTQYRWLDAIRLVGDIRYGTNDYVYLDSTLPEYGVVTRPYETLRYSAGIAVQLSLFDAATRRLQNQSAQIAVETARAHSQEAVLAVKNAVVSRYYELLLSQKMVGILALQKASSELQVQMAELKFERQLMDFIEYSKILEFHTKTLIDFEKATTEFHKNKALLYELAGMPF